VIQIVNHFLTPDECDQIVYACRTNGVVDGGIGEGEEAGVFTDVRNSHVRLMNENGMKEIGLEWFTLKYKEMIREYNERYLKVSIINQTYQFTKYDGRQNHHYTWHRDDKPTDRRDYRKISSTIQLSNPEDYYGGKFEIEDFNVQDHKGWDGKGTLIVFPSISSHRVLPVHDGLRFSMVVWNYGEFEWDKLINGQV
jgi:PKHD-type hydroxylase